LEKIEEEDVEDNIWKFQSIDVHQGPLKHFDPKYKGSSWNVQVLWENGEVSYEPFSIIAKSDPVTIAIYAKENNLLELFARIPNRQRKLLHMANQAKLQSFHTAPTYHFEILFPQNHKHAMELDQLNGNSLWHETEVT